MNRFRFRTRRGSLRAAVAVCSLSIAVAGTAALAQLSTQQPTVAPSRARGEETPRASAEAPRATSADAAREALRREFAAEAVPQWIWGAEDGRNYFLRTEFAGGAKSGRLLATGDNRMTVFLNGKQVATGSEWQQPVQADVSRVLEKEKNELLVEAVNEGGPAGFSLKLVLTLEDGSKKYVVTDKTWQAAEKKDAEKWDPIRALGPMGSGPWGNVFANAFSRPAPDTSRNVFETLPGFEVELLYTVPKESQGSWVAIAFDDKGRLIASDQEQKGLFRVTPPAPGSGEPTRVEPLDAKITAAQGMVHAFGALYLSVNGGPGSGFYRARDTNGDDQYDEITLLKRFQGGGEHGPHAVRLSPDGKSLYVVCGNHTKPPEKFDASRLPRNWGEDLLLPRQWDANGHAAGILAPGGWIAKTDPEGKTWEIVSSGYRNAYDMAFNADGELFSYDSDMEWDMGMPWYRPTRVTHAVSGSEFGWRSGTGKWPAYYVDSLPPLLDIGPGSPVGVEFGYGANFPAKYQQALYILDWTFGTIYALHLEPAGATYKATKEEFLSRTPLPLTDVAIGPDGAMYFTVGGRGVQSELYRVRYVGKEPTAKVEYGDPRSSDLRALRRKLEALHRPGGDDRAAVEFLWPHLAHEDRFIRCAARLALEHRDPAEWQKQAFQATDPDTLIQSMVALARQGDKSLQSGILLALMRPDIASLDSRRKLDLLRAYQLALIRMGRPNRDWTTTVLPARLDPLYPSEEHAVNRELVQLLVYLDSPTVVSKTLELMRKEYVQTPAEMSELLARNSSYGGTIARVLANQPEIQKIDLAFALRNVRYGWTLEQRREYFQWFESALTRSGGSSYQGFIKNIRKDALANMSEAERKAVESTVVAHAPPAELPKPEGPGRDWTIDEIVARASGGLQGRDFARGKRTYAAARCVVCHRFDGEGGATGPDLTNLAGRFGHKELAEALVEPGKVVSDQYKAVTVVTTAGKTHTGRVLGDADGKLTVLTDPEDISKTVEIAKEDVEEIVPSSTSLMPADLLKPLNEEELLDLTAYLLSRGNHQDAMFAGEKPATGGNGAPPSR
ncbi:MAG: c-type cytochrome [Planctomycetales bacterium]